MNKLTKIASLVGVLGMSTLALADGGDFRAPIRNHPKHWGIPAVEETWWYAAMNNSDLGMPMERSCWSSETWLTFYARSADRIFRKEDNSNKNTTNTQSLAALIFGKERFTGQESFAGGNLTGSSAANRLLLANTSPMLGFARITPSADYNEKGLFWGARAEWAWDDYGMWSVGASISVPFKVIEVEPNNSEMSEETLEDVLSIGAFNEGTDAAVQFAARLDFLLSLPGSDANALVRQDTPTGPIRITGGDNLSTTENPIALPTEPALLVISRPDGSIPTILRAASADATILTATGQGTENQIFFVPTSTTLTPSTGVFANPEAQATLFVIPRTVPGNPDALVSNTTVNRILGAIQLLNLENQNAIDFFHDNHVSVLDYDRKTGLGDIDLDLYMRYGNVADWFVKFGIGAKLPTGTKQTDDAEKDFLFGGYHFQTGNNRHFELAACVSAGWVPWKWFDLGLGFSVHHAFKRGSERMPAAFQGATVKNLQGLVDGKVSWTYFTGCIDFGFHHPCNKDLGMDIGYEIFAKTKDHVSFENNAATDLLGRTNQTLSAEVAEMHTNAMLHKFYIDIYNRWNFFEIYAGASHAFAGRNAMKESEAHIGLGIYF